jgi:hypothetical protein
MSIISDAKKGYSDSKTIASIDEELDRDVAEPDSEDDGALSRIEGIIGNIAAHAQDVVKKLQGKDTDLIFSDNDNEAIQLLVDNERNTILLTYNKLMRTLSKIPREWDEPEKMNNSLTAIEILGLQIGAIFLKIKRGNK